MTYKRGTRLGADRGADHRPLTPLATTIMEIQDKVRKAWRLGCLEALESSVSGMCYVHSSLKRYY